MWPKLLANWQVTVTAAVAMFAMGAFSGATFNGWRWGEKYQSLENSQLKGDNKVLTGALDQLTKANARAATAEAQIQSLRAQSGKSKIIYRDAVKGDPKCAEQASQLLVCPRPW